MPLANRSGLSFAFEVAVDAANVSFLRLRCSVRGPPYVILVHQSKELLQERLDVAHERLLTHSRLQPSYAGVACVARR